jgi:hypothetical protein
LHRIVHFFIITGRVAGTCSFELVTTINGSYARFPIDIKVVPKLIWGVSRSDKSFYVGQTYNLLSFMGPGVTFSVPPNTTFSTSTPDVCSVNGNFLTTSFTAWAICSLTISIPETETHKMFTWTVGYQLRVP